MINSPPSRWSPTPEQLMILEEIYRKGIRTPTSSQIQRITAQLSLFGKIEGKNVFYWFQNHKARDRQKLRRKLLLYPPPTYAHHFLHRPFSRPALHHHDLQVGERVFLEDVSAKRSCLIKKPLKDDQEMTMMNVCAASSAPPRSDRPLKTLQLFPITPTTSRIATSPSPSTSLVICSALGLTQNFRNR